MLLGLDIGTSAVKAVCTDGLSVIANATVDLRTSSPKPGWSEQDPNDWWHAVCAALSKLSGSVELHDVAAIGLSGQMHGLVALARDGTVIRPAILWNDNRAIPECRALQEAVPRIGRLAGVPPLPGFTAPKVLWMARYEPDNHARIAHLLLPKDYIGLRLHGGCATDRSDAAGTLWLDQARREWSADLATASDTLQAWLPPLHDGHEIVGQVAAEAAAATGLKQGVPIVAGGGDTATGAVALGATEPGRGFISLGTSGQLFVASDSYRPNPERFVHAFAHTVPGRWYQMAAMLNGARPIAWLGAQLGIGSAEVAKLAEQADPNRVPIFLPYLTGERSPHGDPHIRAGFFGLDDATDRPALCRAVLEGIAFSFADAADSFEGAVDALPELAAIGGGSRSDFLLRLIAAGTGQSIARAAGSDAGPALGAARLAACALGRLTLGDLAARPETVDRFEPEEHTGFAERLARYRALYEALKDIPRN